jgi:NAD(P)H-dependent flavin oxidoreductase YrpB (nitropropane dioxygenase family)
MQTSVANMLGIEFPIFAFSHCRDVVAAVSRAGGLGVLGAIAYTPDELERELAWIDAHSDGKPYGVDVVMPAKYVGKEAGRLDAAALRAQVPAQHRKWLEELLVRHGVPEAPHDSEEPFRELLGWDDETGRALVEVALAHPRMKLIANALGAPPRDVIDRAHERGVRVAALVGTVHHALKQKEAGVDIIVASGYEAGGHTGEITTMVLVPQVVDAVAPLPVLAAGGIGSGRQMAAALMLGAEGVWCGSIWLTTHESDCAANVVEKLLHARSEETVRSRCVSGKPARQLVTAYTKAWESPDCPGFLPMPLQGLLVAEAEHRIRRHAETNVPGAGALLGTPVGQVVGQMKQVRSSAKVVYDLVEECIGCLEKGRAFLGVSE